MTTTISVATTTTAPSSAPLTDDWVRLARCGPKYTKIPAETWFSEEPGDVEAALAVCRTCPVITQCAITRIGMSARTTGVWGGEFYPEKPAPTRRDQCGSHDGALAHKRAHEQSCDDCRQAENAHEARRVAERRKRPRTCRVPGCDNEPATQHWYCSPECHHLMTVGSAAGYHLHQRLQEPPCEPCRVSANLPGSRTKAVAPPALAA